VPDARDEPMAVAEVMAFLPERRLSPGEASGVEHGVAVDAVDVDGAGVGEGDAARLTHEGRLLAVARRRGDLLRPEVVLG
jgi:hypothetical protein